MCQSWFICIVNYFYYRLEGVTDAACNECQHLLVICIQTA